MTNQNLKRLPSFYEIETIINEINRADLKLVSYNKLVAKLRMIQFIPFPTVLVKKEDYIERGRVNSPGEVFTCEKELSYRTDYENIKYYGRANVPHDSLFYGAYKSHIIERPEMIELFEIDEMLRNAVKVNIDPNDFVITVGKWRVKKEFEVVDLVRTEKVEQHFISNKKHELQYFLNQENDTAETNAEFELVLDFFGSQFAKKEINSSEDYMISAAYTNSVLNWRGLSGLKYSSVKSDFGWDNIALSPKAVDNFLELEFSAMYRVIKSKGQSKIVPLKYASNFGPLNSKFNWCDYKRKPMEIIDNVTMAGPQWQK